MELKLEQEYINGFMPMLETELTQEETLEAIVPDAYPDILRVIDCGGQVMLTGKNIHDAEVTVTGTVRAWLLYQPEDGQSVRHMELTVPFTARTTAPGADSSCRCVAQPRLRGMDIRALNPRKILVRADLALALELYAASQTSVCSGIESLPEDGIQHRTQEQSIYTTPAVQEKEFSIYDEIRLAVNGDQPPRLLCAQACPICTESRIIGNKFVFKGEVRLQLRLLCDGQICSQNTSVSFSQIMEVSDVGEGADAQVELCMTGLELSPSGDDARALTVSMDILAQSVIREQLRVQVLEDAYSTEYPLQLQRENWEPEQLTERTTRTQNLREVLEVIDGVNAVIDAQAEFIGVEVRRRDSAFEPEGQVRVRVLYLDEEEQLRCVSRVLNTSVRLEAPAGTHCRCRCISPGDIYATPAAGGIEVRLSIPFNLMLTTKASVPVITQVQPGQLSTDRACPRPSVVLRSAVPGETLWDIAKAYSTTCEQIRKANALDTNELPLGQMLLIPGTC